MFTDAFVTYAVECFAEYAHLSQNVYQYRYVHQGEFGLNPDAGIDKLGKFDGTLEFVSNLLDTNSMVHTYFQHIC